MSLWTVCRTVRFGIVGFEFDYQNAESFVCRPVRMPGHEQAPVSQAKFSEIPEYANAVQVASPSAHAPASPIASISRTARRNRISDRSQGRTSRSTSQSLSPSTSTRYELAWNVTSYEANQRSVWRHTPTATICCRAERDHDAVRGKRRQSGFIQRWAWTPTNSSSASAPLCESNTDSFYFWTSRTRTSKSCANARHTNS